MKIVIVSLSFLPNIGGLENIILGLAEEWSDYHEVVVYTKTPDNNHNSRFSFSIIRKFSLFSLFQSVKEADLYLEANISLYTSLVGLWFHKKWHISHQTCYTNTFFGKLKNTLSYISNNISCSHFVSNELLGNSVIIPNFYNDLLFKSSPLIKHRNSIVFLGRLVSDKGVDLLLEALHVLKHQRKTYQLIIIGDGPEENYLINLVNKFNLQDFVIFKGVLKGQELVLELNRHEIMVIPSKWKEPFGIVALEGLACHCKIVCPDEGGLKEASGSSAFLYRHNSLESLVTSIETASSSEIYFENNNSIKQHLFQHSQKVIANQYLEYFKVYLNGQ
jgi:glycogen(starch) synthase